MATYLRAPRKLAVMWLYFRSLDGSYSSAECVRRIGAIMFSMTTATISVRVQPRARRDELAAVRDGVLVVRLTAPPLDGRANDALCRLLADLLGVRASHVDIVRGQRARDKVVRVEGLAQEAVDAALGLSGSS